MSQLCVLICRVNDDNDDGRMTELACVDVPPIAPGSPVTHLDRLEESVVQSGQQVLRHLCELQWEEGDAAAVAHYQQRQPPGAVVADGYETLTVASRVGTLRLRRQVCVQTQTQTYVMPGNALLPEHQGMLITRGLAEWACLLPQELPFATVARLLSWQTGEPGALSATMVRTLVRDHGGHMRRVERSRASALLERPPHGSQRLQVVPHTQPRRRAGWPQALNGAVEAALAQEQGWPPVGVSRADWERVLAARRAEAQRGVQDLRVLGPQIAPGHLLLTLDEVLTPAREAGRFHELRTACLATTEGRRYLSGSGDAFLVQVLAAVRTCDARSLLVLADGARWIRAFYRDYLTPLPQATMLLDWHHLKHKCHDMAGRICVGRSAKVRLLRRVVHRLWTGDVPRAVRLLAAYRPHAKDQGALDELIGYLNARVEWIPHDRARRRQREYIGSGLAEKANDRIVARRQKNRGMQWSAQTSQTLATLRTLVLNGAWDTYWQEWELMPLCVA